MNRRTVFSRGGTAVALAAIGLARFRAVRAGALSPPGYRYTLVGPTAIPSVNRWVGDCLAEVVADCDGRGQRLVRYEVEFFGVRRGHGHWMLRAYAQPLGADRELNGARWREFLDVGREEGGTLDLWMGEA